MGGCAAEVVLAFEVVPSAARDAYYPQLWPAALDSWDCVAQPPSAVVFVLIRLLSSVSSVVIAVDFSDG